ncbi:MAG: prepilin-type N-terminal cleavage/methylation domain-containing protein [Bacilli bacterium]|nr:prepilin-type N-terminal cleavage/methylation domain-containing protein [Bacilli bacterium]
MKNKKGFTLVELLAVIAILAILVIIALPNVMGMFNTAKKNSFTTELKTILNTAKSKVMLDSINNSTGKDYARIGGNKCGTKDQLDLSGRANVDYFIKTNTAGKIVEFFATDGTFEYSYMGSGIEEANLADGATEIAEKNNTVLTISDTDEVASGKNLTLTCGTDGTITIANEKASAAAGSSTPLSR